MRKMEQPHYGASRLTLRPPVHPQLPDFGLSASRPGWPPSSCELCRPGTLFLTRSWMGDPSASASCTPLQRHKPPRGPHSGLQPLGGPAVLPACSYHRAFVHAEPTARPTPTPSLSPLLRSQPTLRFLPVPCGMTRPLLPGCELPLTVITSTPNPQLSTGVPRLGTHQVSGNQSETLLPSWAAARCQEASLSLLTISES